MYDSFLYRYARDHSEARMREAAGERRAREARQKAGLVGGLGGLSILGPLRPRLEGIAGWLAVRLHAYGHRSGRPNQVAQGA